MAINDKTQTELEAAVFRRLVAHLRGRTDVLSYNTPVEARAARAR